MHVMLLPICIFLPVSLPGTTGVEIKRRKMRVEETEIERTTFFIGIHEILLIVNITSFCL